MAIPGLQFYAYDMQLGEAFLVVGHTLSTIYSTTTDVANYHGKVILFTGDRTATRECVPVVLPPLAVFAWEKCMVVDDRSKLAEWYADNHAEYGNLWDPAPQDGLERSCSSRGLLLSPCGRQSSTTTSTKR